MKNIDTLLHARWLIPVRPANTILENHSLAIHGGKILDVLPSETARQTYSADNTHELACHALIPGLINAHTHAAMALFKGMADDRPLMEWLQSHIWPAEQKWVNKEFVRDGTQLAIAEMLRSGTTCFNDMYFFPDITAEVCRQTHIRASIGLIVLDFPTVWANDAQDYIEKAGHVHDAYLHEDLISTAFAPHAPYTVSDEPLVKIGSLAEQIDIPIHMHVHETAEEVSNSIAQCGKRPLERLDELGLLSPRLLAVHMTQLNDGDMHRVAKTGTHVVHCVESNLKLASGFCPIAELASQGINVCIGTDSNASNNDLDLITETCTAALLAKTVANDASAINAYQALEMMTINAARALDMADSIGSLEVGKAADVVAIDLGSIEMQPVYNPVSQIIYTGSREKVKHVWIAGRHVLDNRTLTTIDENAVIANAMEWADKIKGNRS